MTPFEVATAFFHACEGLKGAEGCQQYMAGNATFDAQCEPLAEIKTAAAYCDWMAAIGSGPLEGCSYDLHNATYDDATRTALFYGTFTGRHTGEGGPVPPTKMEANSHYVYVLTMDADGKVSHMVKIWNAPWALRELGWS